MAAHDRLAKPFIENESKTEIEIFVVCSVHMRSL